MSNYSILHLLNVTAGIVLISFIIELLFMITKTGSDTFFALFKTVFYSLLAVVIYALAHKTDLKSTNPNDYIFILTFVLALFEAAQNLLVIIRKVVITLKPNK